MMNISFFTLICSICIYTRRPPSPRAPLFHSAFCPSRILCISILKKIYNVAVQPCKNKCKILVMQHVHPEKILVTQHVHPEKILVKWHLHSAKIVVTWHFQPAKSCKDICNLGLGFPPRRDSCNVARTCTRTYIPPKTLLH